MSARLCPAGPTDPERLGGKIQAVHLARNALVYVRQSTMQQVDRNQESTRLQYGLAERAVALGWAPSQVVVIDEDLGRSGSSAEGRPGFQRLVAEVGLDHVGLVLGSEMSRLARSSRDWYQLLEVCAVFSTLLADADGLYDPSTYNDRLLLGLKGTMSEAELHILKQRMLEGKRAKARRGELSLRLPTGYVRRPSGAVEKDPDEQARSVVATVFAQFERCGTVYGVLRYLVDHGLRLPYRLAGGPRKGELEWRRPNRVALSNMLHHPAYAGAYVYGRRPTDPRRRQPGRPGTGRVQVAPEQWQVLLKDRWPAYIDWAQYERNLRQLAANSAAGIGVARAGPSLLSGLVVCGRCGRRMTTHYTNNGRGLRYVCARATTDYAEPLCQSLTGTALDGAVRALVLAALEPAALEISLQVAEDLEAERARELAQWQQRLERAAYAAQRAERQYQAVEPENRLVARTLERQWEDARAAQRALAADCERFRASAPSPLSADERAAIRRLAADIPALWEAPTTTPIERQEIVRQLVERVVVAVREDTEQVAVQVHWAGGHRTDTGIVRPVARFEQLGDYPALLARVVALQEQGLSCPAIAERLNAEGWRPPKRRDTFNTPMVARLLARRGLHTGSAQRRTQADLAAAPDEWRLSDLALALDMPAITLFGWIRRGWVRARQVGAPGHARWLVWADAHECERLRARRAAPGAGTDRQRNDSQTLSSPSE